MKALTAILGGALLAGTAATPAGAETLRFAIMRNGSQIGTHRIVINRTGADTSVNIATEVEVKVLFITAYHFQETESERWANDHLVALNSTTDNKNTHHHLAVTQKAGGLECDADGKVSTLDRNIVPSSFWNPEFLRHTTVLDTQDGIVSPMSVVDDGPDQLTINGKTIKAHYYMIKSRYPQDVWYDDHQQLVQVKLVGSDGSMITYKPI
jgi:hypothetical protein